MMIDERSGLNFKIQTIRQFLRSARKHLTFFNDNEIHVHTQLNCSSGLMPVRFRSIDLYRVMRGVTWDFYASAVAITQLLRVQLLQRHLFTKLLLGTTNRRRASTFVIIIVVFVVITVIIIVGIIVRVLPQDIVRIRSQLGKLICYSKDVVGRNANAARLRDPTLRVSSWLYISSRHIRFSSFPRIKQRVDSFFFFFSRFLLLPCTKWKKIKNANDQTSPHFR